MIEDKNIKKIKKLIDSDADIQKCYSYYNEICNHNYEHLNDAMKFANEKYNELCITDLDIVVAEKVTRINVDDNQNNVQTTLSSLKCIYRLLYAKLYKDSKRRD